MTEPVHEFPRQNGAALIAAERERQIREEGWTATHDDSHDQADLVMAAAVYAAPWAIYAKGVSHPYGSPGRDVSFYGIWPYGWKYKGTKKPDGHGINGRERVTEDADRLAELVKAGALIAAEIDRLQRLGVISDETSTDGER